MTVLDELADVVPVAQVRLPERPQEHSVLGRRPGDVCAKGGVGRGRGQERPGALLLGAGVGRQCRPRLLVLVQHHVRVARQGADEPVGLLQDLARYMLSFQNAKIPPLHQRNRLRSCVVSLNGMAS